MIAPNYILNHKKDLYTPFRTRIHRVTAAGANYQPVDLRPDMPSIFDQESLGSCGSQAMVGAMMFDQGPAHEMLSRLFLYYQTRLLMGDTEDDTGVSNEQLVSAAEEFGVCPETLWPYDTSTFTNPPTAEMAVAAMQDAVLLATPLTQDVDTFATMLTMRVPIVTGITVPSSFMDVGEDGIFKQPSENETIEGQHDIVICGINVADDWAILRNSWSVDWGNGGYAIIPLRGFLLNPLWSDSAWGVRRVGPRTVVT